MVEKITNWKLKVISLYRGDYTASFYLREFAKLLNTSHATLTPHLESLEKDRILVSKEIGKNRTFFLNFDNILAKNFIAMAERYETTNYLDRVFLLKKIYKELLKLNLQGSIIIFGSYAKGYKTDVSDIDIFYLGDIDKKKVEKIKRIGKIYGKEINVKKMNLKKFKKGLREGNRLIKEVIKGHIILNNLDSFIDALWRYYEEIK